MYFTEWVHSINLNKVKENKIFRGLIQPEDLFLTFNYTELLEDITWHLNDYDMAQLPYFEKQLKHAGFRGKISTFSL